MQKNYSGNSKFVIVGAGPVGSLLSLYLSKRGYSCDVFERRPDMRQIQLSAGRSINLAVSTRGLFALREVGLEEQVLKYAIPMRGRMIHSKNGQLTFQRYGLTDDECIYSISRSGLNKTLMSAAEKTGQVKIHFQEKVNGIDFDSKTIFLQNEHTGSESEVGYSMVMGTDGSASTIRHEMMKIPGYSCTQDYLEYGYKELTIPPGPQNEFQMEKNVLHIWPRGTYMLIALPNFDGSFTCTLFISSGRP